MTNSFVLSGLILYFDADEDGIREQLTTKVNVTQESWITSAINDRINQVSGLEKPDTT